MTEEITGQCVEIKATLQKLAHVKVSPTARLVALLAECGVTDTAEVASLVGRSVRMVQIARAELSETHCADAKPISRNPLRRCETYFAKPIAQSETHFAKPIAQSETHFAKPIAFSGPSRVQARARIESPSGINITSPSKSDSSARVREIDGLNGSTQRLCDQLAGWLAGSFGVPNPEEARSILVGSVDAYGAEQVKIGMLELETRIAGGQKPRDLGKSFSGFIKNAKPPKAGAAPRKSMMDLIREAKAGASA